MKIGIDCHNLEGYRTGPARYLMNLLKYWTKTNVELDIKLILYFKNQAPNDIPESPNFQKKVLKSNSNALFMHYFLPQAAKKDKIDILFCPNYIAPIFYKGKIALVLHDIIYEAQPNLYNWPSVFDKILLKKVSKISAKKAEIIFTCSQFSKNEILKYYKINPDKVFVIPLAADEKFKPLKREYIINIISDIKDKYRIKNKFIFYVGAIFNRRFIPETIKAFAKIADRFPEYQLLIGGPNYTKPFIDIDSLIKKTNKNIGREAVLHINYINDKDLVLLYNIADVFVWLSLYEGFGLPPLEAMACGTPVLSTKKTSLAEVLGDYPVWVENPKDIEEISKKISIILVDKKLREKMVEKGQEQIKKFSWKKTAEKTLKILLEK